MKFANGMKYSGSWIEGQPIGLGRLTFLSGVREEGTWQAYFKRGDLSPDWISFRSDLGKLKDSQLNGSGTLLYQSGRVERGTWENDQPVGDFTYWNAKGEEFNVFAADVHNTKTTQVSESKVDSNN